MTDPLPFEADRRVIDEITAELVNEGRPEDTLHLVNHAIRKAYAAGFVAGRSYPGAGLTPQKVRRLRKRRSANVPLAAIASEEHVPLDLVREICR